MLGIGTLNTQIAYELGVFEATIKAHVSAVLPKLGVEPHTGGDPAVADRDRPAAGGGVNGRFGP